MNAERHSITLNLPMTFQRLSGSRLKKFIARLKAMLRRSVILVRAGLERKGLLVTSVFLSNQVDCFAKERSRCLFGVVG